MRTKQVFPAHGKPALAAGVAGLVLLMAQYCFAQNMPATQPASATAPAAASMPATSQTLWQESDDMPDLLPRMIVDAMTFDPQEQLILGDTSDGSGSLAYDHGLAIMLKHVSSIRQLPPEHISLLESPPVRLLRKYPDEFRFRPVRLEVKVYMVEKLTPGKNMVSSTYWPSDRNIWQLYCVSAMTPDPEHSPLIITITEDPTDALGTPDQVDSKGAMIFRKQPRRIEVAGIFYRNYRHETRDGGQASYPVVLAWQSRLVGSVESSSGGGGLQGILLGLVLVMLLGAWWWSRQYLRSRKDQDNQRQDALRQAREAREQMVIDEAEAAQIDPALRAAAEEYFREHPEKRPPTQRHAAAAPPSTSRPSNDQDIDPALKQAAEEYRKEHGDRSR